MEPDLTAQTLRTLDVPIMLLFDAAAIAYTGWILRRGGAPLRFLATAAAALFAWLVVLHLLISSRLPLPESMSGIAFLGVVLAGVGLFGIALRATPAWSVLRTLDPKTLALAQGIRILFGAGFLIHAAIGLLPMGFGLLDGISHITAGTLALLAVALARSAAESRRFLLAANTFGLVDILVVASTISLVLLPVMTPYHPMMYAVFLPAPIWLWLHVVSLVQLREASDRTAGPAEGEAARR